jgi:predicted PurR-regulated permease PerM
MEDQTIIKITTLIAIGLLFVLGFLILKDIIIAIILGLLLAYVLHPMYRFLLKYIREKNLTTSIIVLLVILIIAVPLWFLTPLLIRQAFDTYTIIQKTNFEEFLLRFPSLFNPDLAQIIGSSIHTLFGKAFTSFLNQLTDLLVNIPNLLLQFAVFAFTFFFALRDGDKLKAYFAKLSPFSESTEKKMLNEFRGITNAIIFGQVLIGVLQGLLLGIGLFIIGVPKALILTFVAVIASIIPVLGSWIVWLPVSVFLLWIFIYFHNRQYIEANLPV